MKCNLWITDIISPFDMYDFILFSFILLYFAFVRCQWPHGLERGFAADRLLGFRVRIPPRTWMSLISVVCCQVEVSASGWSLVQRSYTECNVSEFDHKALIMTNLGPVGAVASWKKIVLCVYLICSTQLRFCEWEAIFCIMPSSLCFKFV
jgi:hypothetical protein